MIWLIVWLLLGALGSLLGKRKVNEESLTFLILVALFGPFNIIAVLLLFYIGDDES